MTNYIHKHSRVSLNNFYFKQFSFYFVLVEIETRALHMVANALPFELCPAKKGSL